MTGATTYFEFFASVLFLLAADRFWLADRLEKLVVDSDIKEDELLLKDLSVCTDP